MVYTAIPGKFRFQRDLLTFIENNQQMQDVTNANPLVFNSHLVQEPAKCFENVKDTLAAGVVEGVYPGAVLYAGYRDQLIYQGAFGHKTIKTSSSGDATATSSSMSVDTVFDIAGVTGGLVTTTIIMRLVQMGRLKLEDRVSRYLQGFGVMGKAQITIKHLLSHTAGLVAWHPFYQELIEENNGLRLGILGTRSARDFVYNTLLRSSIKGELGGKPTQSDVGLMALGFIIESVTGLPLDKVAFNYVFKPLGLASTSYINVSMLKVSGLQPITEVIAPTEECVWRQKLLWGEVQDDNAWAMGGIAGHSGVFSTASDLFIYARTLLASLEGRSSFVNKETMDIFVKGDPIQNGAGKLGWESPNKDNGMIDSGLSSSAFGINGFTGCSLWIDPATQFTVILMSNRIHPQRANKKIQTFRPQIYKAVIDGLKKVCA